MEDDGDGHKKGRGDGSDLGRTDDVHKTGNDEVQGVTRTIGPVSRDVDPETAVDEVGLPKGPDPG